MIELGRMFMDIQHDYTGGRSGDSLILLHERRKKMRNMKIFLAAAMSAAMTFAPAAAYAESEAVETLEAAEDEAEEMAEEEGETEEPSGWLNGLKGLLDKGGEAITGIFGRDGVIESALPDQEEVDQALGQIKEGLGEIGSGLSGLLGMVGGLFGGGSDGYDAIFMQTSKMKAAGSAYMLDVNAPLMEPGDVQIIANGAVSDSMSKDGVSYSIACFIQQNFTEDEDYALHLLCEKKDLVFFEFNQTEDGDFIIADAEFLEMGDALEESLEKYLPLMYSDSVEECLESIVFSELYVLPDTLAGYLADNPEITGIEYKGEIMTADELKDIRDKQTWEYYGINEEESEEESETTAEAG